MDQAILDKLESDVQQARYRLREIEGRNGDRDNEEWENCFADFEKKQEAHTKARREREIDRDLRLAEIEDKVGKDDEARHGLTELTEQLAILNQSMSTGIGRATDSDDAVHESRRSDAGPEGSLRLVGYEYDRREGRSRAVPSYYKVDSPHHDEELRSAMRHLSHRASAEYRDRFDDYVRSLGRREDRNLTSSTKSDGGALLPVQTVNKVVENLNNDVFMRRFATNHTVLDGTTASISAIDAKPTTAYWVGDNTTADVAANDEIAFGSRELEIKGLKIVVEVQNRLLRRLGSDSENIISDLLSNAMREEEERAFLTGNGVQKPTGIFHASDTGIPTSRDVPTGSETSVLPDQLIDAITVSLRPGYFNRSVWFCGLRFRAEVRKSKGSDNNYLWSPGLDEIPDRLFGRPMVVSELAPDNFTADNYVAVFGDFSNYEIATGYRMNMLVDPYTKAARGPGFTRLIIDHEVDGNASKQEAFVRFKCATVS